jgi:hypothetical protein
MKFERFMAGCAVLAFIGTAASILADRPAEALLCLTMAVTILVVWVVK